MMKKYKQNKLSCMQKEIQFQMLSQNKKYIYINK